MDDGETLIRVENVSKTYSRSLKQSLRYGVAAVLEEFNPQRIFEGAAAREGRPRKLRNSEFFANEDVSFEVRRGECLGLIGHNGAGKTTLLKMLNGLLKPDSGRIELHGRIGALIALSAGFNPVLSGRENILINGSILGFSRREMRSKLDQIIDYAEIGDAIDSPVRTYSSGMQARLGFSVAINLDPDILLIDEVLAVGDVGFRTKCMNSIRETLPKAAVIFVSHSMSLVTSICTHALLMKKGRVAMSSDDLPTVVAGYLAEFGGSDMVVNECGGATLASISVNGQPVSDEAEGEARWGDGFAMEFVVRASVEIRRAVVNVIVRNSENVSVFASYCEPFTLLPGENRVCFSLPAIHLAQGLYSCAVGINEKVGNEKAKLHASYSGVGKFRVLSKSLHALQANAIAHVPGEWVCAPA